MKTYHVRMSFLAPVELQGYIEAENEAIVRETIAEKGKEQGHIDVRVIEITKVEVPQVNQEETKDKPVLN